MIGALAFSIAASALVSFVEVGPRRIRYWLRFARHRYWPAQLGLMAVYVAAGVGGWFLNKEYIVHPPSSAWLANGLLSVGLSQAILRLDPSFLDVDGGGPARSLLVGTHTALFDNIESSAFTAVVDSVRELADNELEQLALDLARIAVVSKDVPLAAQVETLNTLTDAAKEMRTANHSNGRSRLVSFSVKTITENRYVFSF
jgi:hypothetical protein